MHPKAGRFDEFTRLDFVGCLGVFLELHAPARGVILGFLLDAQASTPSLLARHMGMQAKATGGNARGDAILPGLEPSFGTLVCYEKRH
jgi:hypothetical protein